MDPITTFETGLRFFGLELGARMTAINVEGELFLHSPIDVSPGELEKIGTPRYLLAPNKFHHMFAKPWVEQGLESWAPPGLVKKRSDIAFDHTVKEKTELFGGAIVLIPTTCFPATDEVVLFHPESRTLVLCDFLFNFDESAAWATKLAIGKGAKVSLLEHVAMKRERAREEIGALLELDFDRVIMAHGGPIETGGKEALRNAYRWVGL